ncbi:MAG: VanZ family protein [Candidatus Zixiibacteriota bacterium]|nr:MAG: VanZ family protein [candidate division Zixibacteria bacterium]
MTGASRFLKYHLPVILYAGLVIALSSIPNLSPAPLKILAADKIAHFIEYGVFSFLTFRSFSNFGRNISVNRAFLFSIIFMCIFASFDEYYQRFIPGRDFDVLDILTDIAGAVLVLIFMRIRTNRNRNAVG